MEICKKSKTPSDWALADSAVRLSVLRWVKVWYKVELENPLLRLEKHLVKFRNGYLDHLYVLSTCYYVRTTRESSISLYTIRLGGTNTLRIQY
jgi:hypothetical protein